MERTWWTPNVGPGLAGGVSHGTWTLYINTELVTMFLIILSVSNKPLCVLQLSLGLTTSYCFLIEDNAMIDCYSKRKVRLHCNILVVWWGNICSKLSICTYSMMTWMLTLVLWISSLQSQNSQCKWKKNIWCLLCFSGQDWYVNIVYISKYF